MYCYENKEMKQPTSYTLNEHDKLATSSSELFNKIGMGEHTTHQVMIPCPSALNRRFYARDVKVAKTNLTPETLKSSVKCVFETHLKKDVKVVRR